MNYKKIKMSDPPHLRKFEEESKSEEDEDKELLTDEERDPDNLEESVYRRLILAFAKGKG